MPAVATMGECRGRLCWTCGSERACKAEIDVLCHPRTDHFSRSLKGSRLYAREVVINDAEVKDLRSTTERWSEHPPLSMYGETGGGPLDAPFCTDVTLPRFPPPTKRRAYATGKATSSCPRKTVRRDPGSTRAKVHQSEGGSFFVGIQLGLCATPCHNEGPRLCINAAVNRYLTI